MQVAIYARHSTDRQEHSTRDQIARCRVYCQAKGYTVAATFSDEGLSGSNTQNRAGLRELVEASLGGGFSRVIAEDLSRFSRDQGDIANFHKRLLFVNVSLETVAEGVIGELHIGLKGTMNALFLKDLSDKTKRGMIASVLNGSITGGKAYGYDVVRAFDDRGGIIRGRRSVNEIEAAIVRRIFREYQDKKTLQKICDDLNDEGIPSPNGKRWQTPVLAGLRARQAGILRQTLYKGVVTFGRVQYVKHPDSGKRIAIFRPEREWLKIPAPEIAIVEPELFDSVQRLLDERSHNTKQKQLLNQVLSDDERAAKHREEMRRWRADHLSTSRGRKQPIYLTSGKLWCGRHNLPFGSLTAGLYGCQEKGCANRNMQFNYIMPIINSALRKFSRTHLDQYWRSLRAVRIDKQEAIADLNDQLEKERDAIRKLLNMIGRNEGGKETLLIIEEHERLCARIRFDIRQIEIEVANTMPLDAESVDMIVTEFHRNRLRLEQDPRDQTASRVLHSGVKAVVVMPVWDDINQTMSHRVEIEYDIQRLIGSLMPRLNLESLAS